ncbi:MAG: hypothetical protein ACSLEW_02335 [Nocardioides sp.]
MFASLIGLSVGTATPVRPVELSMRGPRSLARPRRRIENALILDYPWRSSVAYRSSLDVGTLRRVTGTVVLALLLASVAFFGTAFVAAADPWGDMTNESNGIGTHPDSDPHTYCYTSGVPSGLSTNIADAMWNAMDPTAVNVDYNSSCDYSSSTETDIVWFEDDLYQASGSSYCDQAYSTLDLAAINVGGEDEIDQTQTACHEAGHTAGLTHGGSVDCMINSADTPPTALQFRRYGEHHRTDHLTPWFN